MSPAVISVPSDVKADRNMPGRIAASNTGLIQRFSAPVKNSLSAKTVPVSSASIQPSHLGAHTNMGAGLILSLTAVILWGVLAIPLKVSVDFIDAMKTTIGLTDKKLAKKIFEEYWKVDAKKRGAWDIPEWEKWLSKYVSRLP